VRRLISRELFSVLQVRAYEWRQRRVQTIVPLDEHHYRERITLQIQINEDLVAQVIRRVAARTGDRRLASLVPSRRSPFHPTANPQRSKLDGQLLDVAVPLFRLPKQILHDFSVEDAGGRRLALMNRFDVSLFSAYHLLSMTAAVEDVGGIFNLVRALAFCIPDGIFSKRNFPAGILGERSLTSDDDRRRGAATVVAYLDRAWKRRRGIHEAGRHPIPGLIPEKEVLQLLEIGARIAHKLTFDWWIQPDGLRDPLVNPLLLLPDHLKLFEFEGGDPDDLPGEARGFVEQSGRFLDLLDSLVRKRSDDVEPDKSSATYLLQRYAQMTHTWSALVDLRVRIGRPELVKASQTTRVVSTSRKSRLRALARQPFGVDQHYPVVIGDAQSTHIEIRSPESTAIRLATRNLIGDFHLHRERVERLFGFGYFRSLDHWSLYTTKTVDEMRRAARIRIGQGGRQDQESPEVGVIYKLTVGRASLHLIVALIAFIAACYVGRGVDLWKSMWLTNWLYSDWWHRVPLFGSLTKLPTIDTGDRSGALQTSLAAIITMMAGSLAARDRDAVFVGSLSFLSLTLYVLIFVLFLDVLATLPRVVF
jgi:hypothetical protein